MHTDSARSDPVSPASSGTVASSRSRKADDPHKLQVKGLTKTYPHTDGENLVVMKDISFDLDELEFLALIGPSGCGKSTLLRMIGGLDSPTAGAIIIDGQEIKGPGAGRGMVFQSFDLFPWRTTRENIAFGLEILGKSKGERRSIADRYIDLVGLQGFADAYPHQLSGGMQQRVGIARALAIEPDLLLMDEPFGALDVQTRDLLQDELLRIGEREPRTVIFVTHSIEEALYLADRVLVLSPRPARIQMDIRAPFGRPRDEDVKASPEFIRLRQEIWHTLKRGVVV